MASTKKPLHLAQDIRELQQSADKVPVNTRAPASALKRALAKIIQDADKLYLDGDEELAYVFYMRYAQIAVALNSPDTKANLHRVLDRCEQLKASLRSRYSQKKIESSVEALPSPPAALSPSNATSQRVPGHVSATSGAATSVVPASPSTLPGAATAGSAEPLRSPPVVPSAPRTSASSLPNGLLTTGPDLATNDSSGSLLAAPAGLNGPGTQQPCADRSALIKGPELISGSELRELLVNGRALVLDCRSSEAFADSHISLSLNVINIPKVYMGITSFTICDELGDDARELFVRRKEFQKVVIVDWDGRGYLSPRNPATCIAEALHKWTTADEAINCAHLKDGYRFWVAAYPHDTTNSKPREGLNKVADGPWTGISGNTGYGANRAVGHPALTGRESAPNAEELRGLTWLPHAFATNVQVVQTPSVAPTVGPATPAAAGAGATVTTTSGGPHIVNGVTGSGSTVSGENNNLKAHADGGTTLSAISGDSAGAAFGAARRIAPINANRNSSGGGVDGGGGVGNSSPRTRPAVSNATRSELSRVDRSSQEAVKQFTQSVNEKFRSDTGTKPRTRSEAAEGATVPTVQNFSYFPRPPLMRSLSLSDIYEESPHRNADFNRLPSQQGKHQEHPGRSTSKPTGEAESFQEISVPTRPSIDRSLKPSNSLDTATVHRPKDGGPSGHSANSSSSNNYNDNNNMLSLYNNNNNNLNNNNNRIISTGYSPSSIANNNNNRTSGSNNNINNNNVTNNEISSQQHALNTATPSSRILQPRSPIRPSLPPKTRRSQSPVQVYGFGPIDRTSGLRNLGNTCYMNSVLQALAHSTEFAQFFVRRKHEQHMNLTNPRGSRGHLPVLFSQLLAQLWSQNETREALVPFRNLMGSMYPMYSTYEQQDSHEFLVNLLDKLHEDLNHAELRNKRNNSDNSDHVVTFPMLATELNKFFTAHNDMHLSVVTQNYEGILVSGLKCQTCEKDSYTFQVFNVLSVPIPSMASGVDILDCFDEFFREETVQDWLCPHCKAKRTAHKHMRIARLPKHLIIHLIRFKDESWTAFSFSSFKKITNVVMFTEELDTRELAQFVYSKEVKLKSYTLYAVVNHYGTISSGHYYADCRFLPKTQWYRYSDHQVTPIHSRAIDVSSAYMLFYSCVD